jgi:hypothetical protein
MEATILYGPRETKLADVTVEGDSLWLPLADLERATGWESKPQGLCRGEVCVPVPAGRRDEWLDDRRGLDLTAFAGHLGQPWVGDQRHRVWAFGDAARTGGAIGAADAPDFTLPDLDGETHSLSDYRGKKVFLFCWASW